MFTLIHVRRVVVAMTVVAASLPAVASSAEKPARSAEMKPLALNRVRFLPAPNGEQAMLGGKFSGSNTSPTAGFEPLAEITAVAAAGAWNDLRFLNTKPYRWIRYEAPAGSFGRVAKLEFFADDIKLTGAAFAPFPSGSWRHVFDERRAGHVVGAAADGQYVGLDIGELAACPRPGLTRAAEFTGSMQVEMKTDVKGAVIRYTTDGTLPSAANGLTYERPLTIDKTTTFVAVASYSELAPSLPNEITYLAKPVPQRTTLHFGNSLSGNALGFFSRHLATAGVNHQTPAHMMGGGITRTLWNTAMIGPGDPTDQARWKDLFTTTKSMGGVTTYPEETVRSKHTEWRITWADLEKADVSDVTFQPRDADVAEEADYTIRWLKLIRERYPNIQPWLYVEWDEQPRERAVDKASVPSRQMTKLYPTATWEESMSAMMLYGEEVRDVIRESYGEGKAPKILPAAIALGMIHAQIERGEFPGAPRDGFYPLLFSDKVHLTHEGSFLVECVWYAAMYGESPEGKPLPTKLTLTTEQAAVMQRLAWDVVKNYPGSGLYEAGRSPCAAPQFISAEAASPEARRITLVSTTPGAWFRYTLDGTEPTSTCGYIYCGTLTQPAGTTLKAVAFKSGHADSAVTTHK